MHCVTVLKLLINKYPRQSFYRLPDRQKKHQDITCVVTQITFNMHVRMLLLHSVNTTASVLVSITQVHHIPICPSSIFWGSLTAIYCVKCFSKLLKNPFFSPVSNTTQFLIVISKPPQSQKLHVRTSKTYVCYTSD